MNQLLPKLSAPQELDIQRLPESGISPADAGSFLPVREAVNEVYDMVTDLAPAPFTDEKLPASFEAAQAVGVVATAETTAPQTGSVSKLRRKLAATAAGLATLATSGLTAGCDSDPVPQDTICYYQFDGPQADLLDYTYQNPHIGEDITEVCVVDRSGGVHYYRQSDNLAYWTMYAAMAARASTYDAYTQLDSIDNLDYGQRYGLQRSIALNPSTGALYQPYALTNGVWQRNTGTNITINNVSVVNHVKDVEYGNSTHKYSSVSDAQQHAPAGYKLETSTLPPDNGEDASVGHDDKIYKVGTASVKTHKPVTNSSLNLSNPNAGKGTKKTTVTRGKRK